MLRQHESSRGESSACSVRDYPSNICDLIGHKVRVANVGDPLTLDFQPGRVTILISEDGRIDDIKIEPGNEVEIAAQGQAKHRA